MTSTNLGGTTTWRSSRYTLIEKLAVGGMGEIFLAHDTALDRKVVIKVLLATLTTDPEYVAMFLDEARAVARCEHPHIVKIFDVGLEAGRYFMALEYLQGWDLGRIYRRSRILGRRVPAPIALRLLIDAALGLHAAHGATTTDGQALSLVHRDVSPNNLFVTNDGVLKVLDFGVAKTQVQRHATYVGQLKGKITYMSPEQCRGETLDRRTDIFALGTVLYELVTGERLFKRKLPADVFNAIVHDPIPPPTAQGEPLDERLVLIISRALQRDRELRFPTALAFADELSSVLKRVYAEPTRDDIKLWLQDLFAGDTGDVDESTLDELAVSGANATRPAVRDTTVDARDTNIKTSLTVEVDNGAVAAPGRRRGVRVPAWLAEVDRRLVIAGGAAGVLLALVLAMSGDPAPAPQSSAEVVVAEAELIITAAPVGKDAQPVETGRIIGKLPALAGDPAAEHERAARDLQPPAPPPTPNPRQRGKQDDEARGVRKKVALIKPPARQSPAPPPASTATTGKLTLQSVPWANVYIDGELIGPTPIIEREVSARSVRVRLVNPELGLEHNEVIAIRPGKITKRRVELASGAAHVSP